MATKLLQPPIQATSRVVHPIPNLTKMMRTSTTHRALSEAQSKHKNRISRECPSGFGPIKASEQSSGLVSTEEVEKEEQSELRNNTTKLKADLYQALQGINRGIFGIPSEKKSEIEGVVEMLESQNPTPQPTRHLHKVGGRWRLVYSTVRILGPKRTKLGLRDFISLGDLFQTINVAEGKAINVITFSVRGLNLLNGQLRIEASFKIASTSRVDIIYKDSSITPDQLMNVFRKNYDLLLGIFNPEGWLEITYLDETLRIGRDDKGNIFILERSGDDG